MEPAVRSGAQAGAQTSKQAGAGSKSRSRRRWRKGKLRGEPWQAARKQARTSCGGRGGPTHSHAGGGRAGGGRSAGWPTAVPLGGGVRAGGDRVLREKGVMM